MNVVGPFLDQITTDSEQIRDGAWILLGAGNHPSTLSLHSGAGVRREGADSIHLTGCESRGGLVCGHALDHYILTAEADILQGKAEQIVVDDSFFHSHRLAF